MTINLHDLRTATLDYAKTKLTFDITNPEKTQPGNRYASMVTPINAKESEGGIALLKVVCHVWFTDADAQYVKFQACSGPTYATLNDAHAQVRPLAPTDFPRKDMYFVAAPGLPPAGLPAPGAMPTELVITELKLDPNPAVIHCQGYADPDLGYLFPQEAPTAEATKSFNPT